MIEAVQILEPLLANFHLVVLRFEAVFAEDGPVAPPTVMTPVFLADALRGALGWQLRRMACRSFRRSVKTECTKHCPDAPACPYRNLYHPEVAEQSPLRGLAEVPRPFALRMAPLLSPQVTQGQIFRFGITLIGSKTSLALAVMEAVWRLEEAGIGRGGHWRKFRLISIAQALPRQERLLWVHGLKDPLAMPEPVHLTEWTPDKAPPKGRLEVRWEAGPLDLWVRDADEVRRRLKSPREITPAVLMSSAMHRLRLLGTRWCAGRDPAPASIHRLNDEPRIRLVGTGPATLFEGARKSHQQENRQPLAGLFTWVVFAGEIAPLHDVLSLVSPLGIGQKTTYGFGQYDLHLTPRQV